MVDIGYSIGEARLKTIMNDGEQPINTASIYEDTENKGNLYPPLATVFCLPYIDRLNRSHWTSLGGAV